MMQVEHRRLYSPVDQGSGGGGAAGASHKIITKDDSNLIAALDKGTLVISSAQKLVLPVPVLDAQHSEPLVNPNTKEQIKDYKGTPIGDAGVVFYNGKDNAWQAVKADGQGVVIINQANAEQAKALFDFMETTFGTRNPNELGLAGFKITLDYARSMLGLVDQYNSDRAFIQSKMTRAVPSAEYGNADVDHCGLMKRDDRDICKAVYIEGNVKLLAAAEHNFDKGGVAIQQGKDIRGCQSDVFEQTYRHADGRPIKVSELPKL